MSLRERKKAATRAALIAAARELFAEKGYENTTLSEICEAVQIHVTTFFSYFESKEELAFARTLEMLAMFKSEMAERLPATDPATLFWNFMHEFSLQSRSEESAIMQTMESVPALRNRYNNIVQQYEDEMALAFSNFDGVEPVGDLYAKLKAAALLRSVVVTARWLVAAFGSREGWGADPEVLPKLIYDNFPTRSEFQRKFDLFRRQAGAKRAVQQAKMPRRAAKRRR